MATDAQKDIDRIRAALERAQEYAWERRYGGLRPLWEDCTMALKAVGRVQGQIDGTGNQEKAK